MIKLFIYTLAASLLCYSYSVHSSAFDYLPTVSELQRHLAISNEKKHNGTYPPDVPAVWVDWHITYVETQLALVSGHLASFHDRLRVLEAIQLQDSPSKALNMLNLYSLAVEAGVPTIDADRFSDVLDVLRDGIKFLRRVHGPNFAMTDSAIRRIRANHLYLKGDVQGLRKLLRVNSTWDEGLSDSFVKGYISLLLAKLEQPDEHALKTIEHLRPLIDRFDSQDDPTAEVPFVFHRGKAYYNGTAKRDIQQAGLASLYVGTAHRILASNTEGHDKEANLEQAAAYARKARHNLELVDVPVIWSLAMFLTSDVLAMAHDLSETSVGNPLKELSDRAYELGAEYH